MNNFNTRIYLSVNNNNNYKIRSNNKSECEEIFLILKKIQEPVDLTVFDQLEDVALKPLNYLREKPFVDTKIFVNDLNYWLKVPHEKLKVIEEVFELLIDENFIFNDIADNKTSRRSQTAVHIAHGIPSTIACCNYTHFLVLEKLLELEHPDALKYYLEAGKISCQGQAVDIYWREISKCPTLVEYLSLTYAKSSNYLIMVYKIMKLFSTTGYDLEKFVNLLGIYTQYRSDYKNLFDSLDNSLNNFASNITEGKFTFPLIHAVQTMNNDEVYEIVKRKPRNLETKRKCVNTLKEIGSQEHCLSVLKALHRKLCEEAKKIGQNPYMEMALEHLMDF